MSLCKQRCIYSKRSIMLKFRGHIIVMFNQWHDKKAALGINRNLKICQERERERESESVSISSQNKHG